MSARQLIYSVEERRWEWVGYSPLIMSSKDGSHGRLFKPNLKVTAKLTLVKSPTIISVLTSQEGFLVLHT